MYWVPVHIPEPLSLRVSCDGEKLRFEPGCGAGVGVLVGFGFVLGVEFAPADGVTVALPPVAPTVSVAPALAVAFAGPPAMPLPTGGLVMPPGPVRLPRIARPPVPSAATSASTSTAESTSHFLPPTGCGRAASDSAPPAPGGSHAGGPPRPPGPAGGARPRGPAPPSPPRRPPA